MKKSTIFFTISGILLIVSLLLACQDSPSQSAGNETSNTTEIPKTPVKPETKSIAATYKSATVYAAATDYYFEKEDGETLEIRVSNILEEQLVKLAKGMLEENVDEGPPDANPEMVGKIFNIIYNTEGDVIEISLAG